MSSVLALLGGEKTITLDQGDMFTWPIITEEHEKAVLEVLRAGKMSGLDITKEFEKEYSQALGRKYALTAPNGTASILEAWYGLGIGAGDEVIVSTMTYWASILQVYLLGATPVFADIDSESLTIDPADIEKRITERTKLIVAVHYAGMPCDMDAIMDIAKKHNLKVFEDCSHAHGGLYKGKEVGTFGDAAGFSLMSGKPFAIGEAGIFFTDDKRVYEKAILFGHYVRHSEIEIEDIKECAGLPCGGFKNRLNQMVSAYGRVQLKLFPQQLAQIQKAMNYLCDLLEGLDGVKPTRPKYPNSTRGGWYYPHFNYVPEELEGLSVKRFAEAVTAEGSICNAGCNAPLHLHPVFTKMDIFGHGRPTRIANLAPAAKIEDYNVSLPVAEDINRRTFEVPWFKHYRPEIIEEHARAYKKVVENYKDLLEGDAQDEKDEVRYTSFFREQEIRTKNK
ncbi:MAG: DegT/DnrJ/EryC1/StrS family aminotransferase [Planctomycetota bacterium]|jgi:dTDP-4-amino-4,6-dideoxygalactose transaminase